MEDSPDHLRQAIDDALKSLKKSAKSARLALKHRRNALAPISRLPPETIATIFYFLHSPRDYAQTITGDEEYSFAWLHVAHVCHQWREIALNHPRFWSRIDFTALTMEGITEILSRSKMAPLHLEANISHACWESTRLDAFQKQLVAHTSHTCRLGITASSSDLQTTVDQLVSPAPVLESLSLTSETYRRYGMPRTIVPPDLFGGSTPRLSHLQLNRCDINWTSPLFKNLQFLELHSLSRDARPSPAEWLDAMDQMTELEVLIAYFATPMVPLVGKTLPEPTHVITHRSLIRLRLSATASDCAFALTRLILPKLKSVRVDIFAESSSVHDVRALIPYVSHNAHGPQDAKPLQSMAVSGGSTLTEIILWTESNADIEVRTPVSLLNAALFARAIFTVSSDNWRIGAHVHILEAFLVTLPLSSLSSLTAQHHDFHEALWLDQAPHWPLLENLRLVGDLATMPFIKMLTRNTPPDGPLLPSLTKLILVNCLLANNAHHLLLDMLIGRVEQGVPLEALDLGSCAKTYDIIQLLNEIVADVQRPERQLLIMCTWPTLSNWSRDMAIFLHEHVGVYHVGYEELEVIPNDSMVNPWSHGYTDDEGEGEDEDEDEMDLDLV
jgi:hypothetical protein